MTAITTGTKLANGALVLETKLIGNEVFVLAYRGDDYTPFVTWMVDKDKYAFYGHYFPTLSEATKDFDIRY